jgi:hypothetical protein
MDIVFDDPICMAQLKEQVVEPELSKCLYTEYKRTKWRQVI